MNKTKKGFLYFVVSLIIIVVSLYLYNNKDFSSSSNQGRNFSVSSYEKISKIVLSKASENAVTLELTDDKSWVLNKEYQANNLAVNDLIRTTKNLSVNYPVAINERDSISSLLRNEGVRFDVYSRRYIISIGRWKLFPFHRKINSFFVGDDVIDNNGTYMQIAKSDYPYIVHIPGYESGLNNTFIANHYEWRDPVVTNLTPSQIKKVKVQITSKEEESFIFINNNGIFEFKDIENNQIPGFEFDIFKTQRFVAAFSELYFEKLIYGENLAEANKHMDTIPSFIIELEGINSKTTNLKIYSKILTANEKAELGITINVDPNLFYLLINDNDYALARYFVFNRVFRPLSFYQNSNN
jgi:hypothetical protein